MTKRKTWTLQKRNELAKRWAAGESAAEIARDFGMSPATIYSELKRGEDGTLDENARPHYVADKGQRAYQAALRNRGRRRAGSTA